jgi:hypothetical protein
MSAYQDLMTALAARRPDQSAADDERVVLATLAKHAHELAEQQRAWIADRTDMPWWADQIPDVIDPQKSAGPVRPDEERDV